MIYEAKPPNFTTLNGHGPNEGKYFFSRDHCQMVGDENWVPVSFTLPQTVVPRPGLEDGVVDTLSKYVFIFHRGEVEIPNPDPAYTPSFRSSADCGCVYHAEDNTPCEHDRALWAVFDNKVWP